VVWSYPPTDREIASTVLSRILPLLKDRQALVGCHDMRDNRSFSDADYAGRPVWIGQTDSGYPMVHLGNVFSSFEQVIPIIDFCSRNRIKFHSAAHSIFANNPKAKASFEAEPQWPYCLWYYFSTDGSNTIPGLAFLRSSCFPGEGEFDCDVLTSTLPANIAELPELARKT